jgi:hypothetical protein
LSQRPTTEELALHILQRVYEDTEGRPMEWRTLATNKTGEAAVELADFILWSAGGHSTSVPCCWSTTPKTGAALPRSPSGGVARRFF